MKILVFGNINSGKSYIVDKLQLIMPTYKVVQLDEYRKLYSDGTIDGEEMAVNRFIEDITSATDVIVEATGLGNIANKLCGYLAAKSFVILKVMAECDESIRRIDDAKFDAIPYPYKYETIEATIKRLDSEINSGAIENIWSNNALDIIEIDSNQKVDELNLWRYERIIDTIDLLVKQDEISEVVIYGSLARREFYNGSDADIMVTTDVDKTEVQRRLSALRELTFTDILPDKITLYFNDFLIEIAVVRDMYENELYYTNSCIDDIEFSVIKGREDTIKRLTNMCSKFILDRNAMIDETVRRLIYFVLSLDGIASAKNEYKFFFHSNIITHEIVRLKKQINNDLKYNYLPKNSDDIFAELEANGLIYNYHDDMKLYINKVRLYVRNLLLQIPEKNKKYENVLLDI